MLLKIQRYKIGFLLSLSDKEGEKMWSFSNVDGDMYALRSMLESIKDLLGYDDHNESDKKLCIEVTKKGL